MVQVGRLPNGYLLPPQQGRRSVGRETEGDLAKALQINPGVVELHED